MYIVAIAWLYVVLMMALTERSVVAGIATFVFYGLLPLALFLWLVGTPQRRRNQLAAKSRPNIALDEAESQKEIVSEPSAATLEEQAAADLKTSHVVDKTNAIAVKRGDTPES